MSRRPLAARFDDFDEDDARRHAAYLDAQAATPFWRERKRASFDLLGLRPGMSVLDVGCGTGDDVRAVAAAVSPGGEAVGVDTSEHLVAEALRRSPGDAAVAFRVADAAALPFRDGSFDAVRAERVLQHVADPVAAVREMARVARGGAAVVAIEPEWSTLAIEGEPQAVGRAVCRRWAASIPNPRVGSELPALLAAAGLRHVEHDAHTSVLDDLGFAREQLGLDELVRDAADPAAARRWLEDLSRRQAEDFFRARVVYVTARAVAP